MHTILVKLSGEALSDGEGGIAAERVREMAREIAAAARSARVAVVVGGGNIWRFRNNAEKSFLERYESDFLGMLATVMNGVALAGALREAGVAATCFSAIPAPEAAVPYSIPAAKACLDAGGVAVLSGGTGRPYVTTDTATALRALELGVTEVVKLTTVDGVYDRDPRGDAGAVRYEALTYAECLEKKLGVLDSAAFALLSESEVVLRVCALSEAGVLAAVARGEGVGTRVAR